MEDAFWDFIPFGKVLRWVISGPVFTICRLESDGSRTGCKSATL
jgi:hypothetical protein